MLKKKLGKEKGTEAERGRRKKTKSDIGKDRKIEGKDS